MSMYVLQVLSGAEKDVCAALLDQGIPAYTPEENRQIRSGGLWRARPYLLFRGYVFVVVRDVRASYYQIRRIPGVLRWLELHAGQATALTPGEEDRIRRMGGQLLESHVLQLADDLFEPVDGPLKEYADAGVRILYNRHLRRAYVFEPLSVMHNRCLRMSFTLIK
ncbi:transcription termination/antitermination NusG family protein [Ethanoligenens harbinense]|uniref:NGN domain-containing protein n=1 Tax=Ethanoligenens harbinense (strain DSM 18485 / JCM 12961 / CGMCC 1.5033 / YUAN-3) TaxID=663278 RepID=E6U5Z9_ETHHY|nr:transcription termination/antitermination NusG family protein [Ethanoligenens harbinense]ADU25678.1 NGN domain-containing protein [Ethanoligenens harbinense YUAN-3]AVQ94854.1 antitermination protein NusG [Ethanoligenens harbinense YUAN-3]AYF37545.1 antitermination protein NusG [Ethanoligenens harbinense]AYF40265.1 antitermination protein NusG [Ethanoligenens harbinense]QCN91100.1 antitermination protein NusG [Ethanoligenens harbinense]